MPEGTADIVGTQNANFTFTLSAATITSASLQLPDNTNVDLPVSGSGREVTVPKLPAGDSLVTLGLIWAPGDPNAIIDVGTVTSGTVAAANPKHRINAGEIPGFVQLFGK